jgi:hypothetical protein
MDDDTRDRISHGKQDQNFANRIELYTGRMPREYFHLCFIYTCDFDRYLEDKREECQNSLNKWLAEYMKEHNESGLASFLENLEVIFTSQLSNKDIPWFPGSFYDTGLIYRRCPGSCPEFRNIAAKQVLLEHYVKLNFTRHIQS